MAGSSTGVLFRVTTFGESHGAMVGAVIDGCPAGLRLDFSLIAKELERRRPGASAFTSVRSEDDKFDIVSGLFEGVTTGTPLGIHILNANQRPGDYDRLRGVFRPSHADYGYFMKYGLRDHRGGGRASGRETAARVAAGAVAKQLLSEFGISVSGRILTVSGIDYGDTEQLQIRLAELKSAGDTAGGVCELKLSGVPAGLGETVFDKYDAELCKAIMSVGAVKGVEVGLGFAAADIPGSKNNDAMRSENGRTVKLSNNSGGISGGHSDGADIIMRAAVKPAPSIAESQQTVNEKSENAEIRIAGRHDTALVLRALPVLEAMAAIVTADMLMRNACATVEGLRRVYRTN